MPLKSIESIRNMKIGAIKVVNAEYPGSERDATEEDLIQFRNVQRAYYSGNLVVNGKIVPAPTKKD